MTIGAGVASATGVCPAIGASSVCSTLITITDTEGGGFTLTATLPVGGVPYDGSEDSLIGVVNASSSIIYSLYLTGNNIFGFESDGMCSSTYSSGVTGTNSCTGETLDPNGYGGNFVNFSITDASAGNVLFVGGLAAGGGTQYFSLEENTRLEANLITPTGASDTPEAPEPGTMVMLGGAMVALGLGRKYFHKN